MIKNTPFHFYFLILLILTLMTSCLVKSTTIKSFEASQLSPSYQTSEMVKAHLFDGSVVLFRNGFKVFRQNNKSILQANGEAFQYDLVRSDSSAILITGIEFSKVAAIEIYPQRGESGSFFAALPMYVVGGTALGVAIFGSCPTYYTTSDNGPEILQGEGFSYSISPRSELEDIDKITKTQIAPNENLQLTVKNEALETHYINQFRIQQVNHAKNSIALPTVSKGLSPKKKQHILIMGGENAILSAKNSQGKDVLTNISQEDTVWYQSPIEITEKTIKNPKNRDWLKLEIENRAQKSTLFLGMKLRNTLLNSVFLYDLLLGSQGFEAIDWVAEKSNKIPYLIRFNKYYRQYFGLPIEVFQNGKWKQIARLSDQGPIAWSHRGMSLEVPKEKVIKLRLKFLPDNWMIDWVSASFEGNTKAEVTVLEAQIINPALALSTKENLANLLADNKKHLITNPGDVYQFNFKTASAKQEEQSSFFIYSKGYYIEWLRNDWLENSTQKPKDLILDESLIQDLFAQWLIKKEAFEKEFFESKINPDLIK